MAVGNLLTELGSAIVAFLQTFLPGVVEAFVGTFDALAFTGEGDAAKMTAAFGWLMIGAVFSLGIWLFKVICHKAFAGNRV